MKKFVFIITAILLVVMSAVAFADETFKVPKYNGKFVGITVNQYGNPSNGKGIVFKKDINRKVKKAINNAVISQSKSSDDNVEFAAELMTNQRFTDIQFVTNTFSTLEEAFSVSMLSSQPGYYGLMIFDQKARKEVVLDVIFVLPNGKSSIRMAIGHCGNTYGLVRTLDENKLAAAFDSGKASAKARADREAAEEAAATAVPYQPTAEEVTAEGGIIVTSTY